MRKFKKKVVVAMSGGVDSSVAAALLKRAGFNVIGVFLKLSDFSSFKAAEIKAKKVAKILKIPFLVLDLRKEFKKRIINYFLEGYKKGITPNPCVVCNKEIKLGLLLEKALSLDADYIATGHYARKQRTENRKQKTKYKLLKAKDKNKDQSYFLWQLNQKQLRQILFPIGSYTLKKVKSLAKAFELSFLLKSPKSVEICFVPKTVEDFLRHYLRPKPGKIVDVKGNNLAEHQGLHFYTIGQRKKIGLGGGPYWVLDKNLKKNILVVTKNEKDLSKKDLILKKVNWISGKEPKLPLTIKAKIRYRHRAKKVTITKIINSKYYILNFEKPQRAVTPGQSAVFYKRNELLGGGIIC